MALELAARWGGEIVNADAFQIYDAFPVLTAQPSARDRERAAHHLYGVLDPRETLDAARYADLARPVIEQILRRGHPPIIVGGSGLYLKALTHGLSPLPPVDRELRRALEELPLADRAGWLGQIDPESGSKIDLKNPRYITRALELTLLNGQPASALRTDWESRADPDVDAAVLTYPDRAVLYARIDGRARKMLADGVVAEVSDGPERVSPTLAKAIGLAEFRALARGEMTEPDVLAAVAQATRRYAKRQATWFRRERVFQTICLGPGDDARSAAAAVVARFPQIPPSLHA